MDTQLDHLDPVFKPKAVELLARLTEARIPAVIINTRRSAAEQAKAVATGVSWVAHSKHEDGLAIDVCPYETYILHGASKLDWSTQDPVWQAIGRIGEGLGLRWGGRWSVPDLGHFEYIAPVITGVAV